MVPWPGVAVHDPWMCVLGGYQGGYTGWVIRVGTRVGNTRAPRDQLLEEGRPMTAKRAPEAPARGLEWVVMGLDGRTGPGPSPHAPTHPGTAGTRSVPVGPPW